MITEEVLPGDENKQENRNDTKPTAGTTPSGNKQVSKKAAPKKTAAKADAAPKPVVKKAPPAAIDEAIGSTNLQASEKAPANEQPTEPPAANQPPDSVAGATEAKEMPAKKIKAKVEKASIKKTSEKPTAKKAAVKKAAPPKDVVIKVKKVLSTAKGVETTSAAHKGGLKKAKPATTAKPATAVKKSKTAVLTQAKGLEELKPSTGSTAKAPKIKAPLQKAGGIRRIVFQVRFFTRPGQSLSVIGNHPLLGSYDTEKAFPLQFLDRDNWYGVLDLPAGETIAEPVVYNYVLTDVDGSIHREWGDDKMIDPIYQAGDLVLIDSWNDASYIENNFYTEPFQQVLLKNEFTSLVIDEPDRYTHIFKVRAPLVRQGQVVCLLGANPELGEWNEQQPVLMTRKEGEDHFSVKLDLSDISFPIVYKYGIYDVNEGAFKMYEGGNNRIIFDSISPTKLTVVNDGFVVLPNTSFRAAGVAVPVFSLRSQNGFGVGEFNDVKILIDWAKTVGLKLVQILPVNDTTATHTFADSYPYAAISAFALHPIYLHIPAIIRNADAEILNEIEEKRQALQQLPEIDYEGVMNLKWDLLRKIFPGEKEETFDSDNFQSFFTNNKHWLIPYAAFSYFRDENGTADFSKWTSHRAFDPVEVAAVAGDPNTAADDVAIHYFIQYHLHLQLQAATAYAHANGIIVKGDIPIGIYRNSCDAWQQPELYNMEMQAGAPPDDFAIKGQNWGFPTYNWQRMQQDGFTWWKLRFEQMSYYFDAFRIDHILGFFRIWSIPMHSVEGILGHFVPALPVHINELLERGIHFDRQRFVQPFITDQILYDAFGDQQEYIKSEFLDWRGNGQYDLKEAFNTQRKIEAHFATLGANPQNDFLKQGLFDLVSNVILLEVEGSHGQQFHMRISMELTSSFTHLDAYIQQQLSELYINYFFRRQDSFWEREAMHKLPELKRSTNMLICGEDLGMVPDCVPGVMKRLSILSLEIQRMPKDPNRQFFHPNDAPYLSVVTPSTHDMSTIRGWWEEDHSRTQQFFNRELGQWGDAPYFCEPWINKAIVLQHLYSPAMWSIFQLQDLLGSSETLRRENPNDERINIPADPKHYWRYRLHIPLEDLLQQDNFNNDLHNSLQAAGRL